MSKLSILICTHNRAKLLARTLSSLNNALRPHDWSVEILVAANACSDDTHNVLHEYECRQTESDFIPMKWFIEPAPGKSIALNSAIPRLDGDIVAFVDDDHRVDSNYIVNICRAADNYRDASLFCGRILPDWDGTEPDWVHDEGPYRIYPLPIPRYDQGPTAKRIQIETGPLPGGGNLFLRVDVFKRVGGFSTKLGPKGHDLGGGEDSAFIKHALSDGERLQYVPDVLQYHYVDNDRLRFSYLLRKSYQRSRYVSRVHQSGRSVPLYMWRKLAEYGLQAAIPVNRSRARFYLMRIASTLGEIHGLRESIKSARNLQRPVSYKPQKFWPILFILLILSGLFELSLSAPTQIVLSGITASITVSTAMISIIATKSIVNFSQTGPQVKSEILSSFRYYSLFAFLRLAAYTYVILLLQTGVGILLYGASTYLIHQPVSFWEFIIAGILSTALITGLQFCRHLLLLPASLAASSPYRISRLYPLWRMLSPQRLRLFAALLWIPSIALALLLTITLIRYGNVISLLSLGSFVGATIVAYLWLRPSHYPQPTITHKKYQHPNILMIGCDTLRADRINPKLTPFIDRLARKGTHFTNCYVPCARTAPSLISLLSGTWPHNHGVRDNFVADSDTNLKVSALPELLRKEGYTTAALSDWCGSDMGKFPLGFDYIDLPEDQWNLKFFIRQGPKHLRLFLSLFTHNAFGKFFLPEIHYLGGVPLTDELGPESCHLINRLAENEGPFLLNVFFSTTHPPFGSEYPYYTRYSTPEYVGESKFVMSRLTDPWEILRRQAEPRESFDLDQIIHLYDGCVTRFDDEVARIVNHLEKSELSDNTIVVIYSDHGMEFFEHGTWGQGNSAIAEASPRVPLIIIDPRQCSQGERNEVVRTVDLAPTLLDLLDLQVSEGMDGKSLAPILKGDNMPEMAAYFETGLWLTPPPNQHPEHFTYPNLMELLEIPAKDSGTLAIKHAYQQEIDQARDRMIRKGRWKLVQLALKSGPLYRLFDLSTDPQCHHDVASAYPEKVTMLADQMEAWLTNGGRTAQISQEADGKPMTTNSQR